MIGVAVLRVRQADAKAEAVERLPTPGGMPSLGSPPPVGGGTVSVMPADGRFQQQTLRLVRAATSTIPKHAHTQPLTHTHTHMHGRTRAGGDIGR